MDSEEFNNFMEFKKKYTELINLVYEKSGEDKLKTFIDNVLDEDLKLLIDNFCKNIENDKKSRKLFLNRNERLFSETNNVKIIPSFNLKSFLAKCDDTSYIWECIQLLYAIYRSGDDKYKELVTRVVEKIEMFNLGEKQKPDDNVDNIIMDIADTLRNNLVTESRSNTKVNPIENMMKTSQMISEKYGNQLRQGKISMNDMFNSLGKMMDQIDKKTSNDDELKNIDISDMPKPEDLMKDLGLGGSEMGNPMDMLSSLMGKGENTKKKLTPQEVMEMEEFYSSMGTDDFNKNDSIEIIETNDNLSDNIEIIDDKTEDKVEENSNNIPDLNNILSNMINNNNDGEDINAKLDDINNKLISQLPTDKQNDIKMMTENMMKMMSSMNNN